MASIRVRPARSADIEGIYRVTYASWNAAYAGILPDEFLESMPSPSEGVPDDQRERLETCVDGERMTELVAVDDGESEGEGEGTGDVVGFAEFVWAPEHTGAFVGEDEAGLRALYLDPDYQRRGIGTRLLERGLGALPKRLSRLKVGVLAVNDDARRFYEANGFERVGSTTFETDGDSHPERIYAREL